MGVHSAQNTQRRRGRRNRRSSVAPFGPLSQTSRLSWKSDPGKELDALPTKKKRATKATDPRPSTRPCCRGLGNHRKGELVLKRKLSQGHRRPLIHRPPPLTHARTASLKPSPCSWDIQQRTSAFLWSPQKWRRPNQSDRALRDSC